MKAGEQPKKLERGMVLVEPGSCRQYSIKGFPSPGWVTLAQAIERLTGIGYELAPGAEEED